MVDAAKRASARSVSERWWPGSLRASLHRQDRQGRPARAYLRHRLRWPDVVASGRGRHWTTSSQQSTWHQDAMQGFLGLAGEPYDRHAHLGRTTSRAWAGTRNELVRRVAQTVRPREGREEVLPPCWTADIAMHAYTGTARRNDTRPRSRPLIGNVATARCAS